MKVPYDQNAIKDHKVNHDTSKKTQHNTQRLHGQAMFTTADKCIYEEEKATRHNIDIDIQVDTSREQLEHRHTS